MFLSHQYILIQAYKYFFGMFALRFLYTMYAPASITWTAITTKTNMPILGADAEMTVAGF